MLNKIDDPVWSSTDILSLAAILDWACGDATSRRRVLREAVISACKKHKIRYKLRNDIITSYLTDDTVNDNDLLIYRKSFEKWYHETHEQYKVEQKKLDPRLKEGYLNLIGVFLKILVSDEHGMRQFGSQNELKTFIEENYSRFKNIGFDSLGQKFAEANKHLDQGWRKKSKR